MTLPLMLRRVAPAVTIAVFTVACGDNVPVAQRTANQGASQVLRLPGALGEHSFLYVTDFYQNYLYGFSYPGGKQIATISKDMARPEGECVDKSGEVWVVDNGGASILAFAHGGTKPEQVLNDPNTEPGGCSVDPASGDLAVTNMGNAGPGVGSVAIYTDASGTPKQYTDPSLERPFFCSYDDKGNLFVDGLTRHGFGLAELSKGASSFKDIAVSQTIYFPGGVEWDGRYLAVGDQDTGEVYQFAVVRTRAVLEGTTLLKNSRNVAQFWLVQEKAGVQAVQLVAPDAYGHDVKVYNYPAGGSPVAKFSGRYMWEPLGAAVTPDKAL